MTLARKTSRGKQFAIKTSKKKKLRLTQSQKAELKERIKYIKEYELGATSAFIMIQNIVYDYDKALHVLKEMDRYG